MAFMNIDRIILTRSYFAMRVRVTRIFYYRHIYKPKRDWRNDMLYLIGSEPIWGKDGNS